MSVALEALVGLVKSSLEDGLSICRTPTASAACDCKQEVACLSSYLEAVNTGTLGVKVLQL